MTTIVFQGDSITDFGRSRDEAGSPSSQLGFGYADLAASRWLRDEPARGLKYINRGISGNRVVDLYARWKMDALNLQPDLISILIGVNDVWHEFMRANGVEADRFEEVYRLLLRWTKKVLPDVKLLIMEPFLLPVEARTEPDFRGEVELRAAAAKRVAAEFGATFLPLQKAFDDACKLAPAEHWLYDGVHPAPAGHQLIADLWLETAKKLLNGK